jgi:LPXTG-motif cell wall-anchored protein
MYSKVGGNDVLTATFTTDALNTLLNTSGGVPANSVLPPDPYPGTSLVTAINGAQYNKGYYFGRPKDHTTLTPTALPLGYTNANVNQNIYSHAYLNVYASGSMSFSKVEFIGGGFELDNVAVSNQLRTPSSELVLLQSVLGKSIDFRANGGTGSMPAQTSDTASTLSPNTFTRSEHTFAGWSTSPTGTVEYADSALYAFGADLTLYAVWVSTPTTSVEADPEPTSTTVEVPVTAESTTTTAPPAVTTTTTSTTTTTTTTIQVTNTTTTLLDNTVTQLAEKTQTQKLPMTGKETTPIIVVGFIALLAGLALRHRPRQRI